MKRMQTILYSPKGFAKPRYARDSIRRAFEDVARWYWERLGVTFRVNQPWSFVGRETWSALTARWPQSGFEIWRAAMADIKSRGYNLCVPDRGMFLIYFRPPTQEGGYGLGGMVGVENFGCGYDRPGCACMSDHMTYLLAGKTRTEIEAMGWAPDWWASTRDAACGAVAHEILHIFTDAPHADAPGDQVSQEWWSWPRCELLPAEAEAMRAALA